MGVCGCVGVCVGGVCVCVSSDSGQKDVESLNIP